MGNIKEKIKKYLKLYILLLYIAFIIYGVVFWFLFINQQPYYSRAAAFFIMPLTMLLVFLTPLGIKLYKDYIFKDTKSVLGLFSLIFFSSFFHFYWFLELITVVTSPVIYAQSVDDIKPDTPAYIYSIEHYTINAAYTGSYYYTGTRKRKGRKRNETYNLWLTNAITDSRSTPENLNFWIYKKYNKDGGDKISTTQVKNFISECKSDFKNFQNMNNIYFFTRIPDRWISTEILGAVDNTNLSNGQKMIVFEPHTQSLSNFITLRILYFILTSFLCIGIFMAIIAFNTQKVNNISSNNN